MEENLDFIKVLDFLETLNEGDKAAATEEFNKIAQYMEKNIN